jgi:DNA mismatch endonuclease (patch repair protein)
MVAIAGRRRRVAVAGKSCPPLGIYFRLIPACASVADIYSKTKRAEIMSLVRGRGNKSTELLAVTMFRKCGIRGWRRHVPLAGRPDFVFKVAHVAVFIDGCFWHMCPIHGTIPKANAGFWAAKLTANRARDRRVDRILRAKKWRVIRIWQHDLRQRPVASIRRVNRALDRGFQRELGAASVSSTNWRQVSPRGQGFGGGQTGVIPNSGNAK